jgi:hypothetical protein
MRWPGSRDSGKEHGQPAEANPEVHRSLGLAALFQEIRRDRKLQVLDLGSAVGSNVEFLSRYDCKLYIEDLYAALAARGPAVGDGEEAGPQFFADFLPLPETTHLDVILAWDTFNYLSRRELAHLVARLRPYCQPGTLIFALISNLKQIPAQPIRFRIVDEEKLAYELRTTSLRPSPRYAPAELTDILSGFRVDRSYLLRHGIQEYLFVRDKDLPGPPPAAPPRRW